MGILYPSTDVAKKDVKPTVATICRHPHIVTETTGPSVFLTGSAEVGVGQCWQDMLAQRLSYLPVTIVIPHQENFHSSWEQRTENPDFAAQANWELECQHADVIAMYLQPGTASPIALLELGLFVKSGKLLVCCPEGFTRKDQVEYVCKQHDVPLTDTWEEFVKQLTERLESALASSCQKAPSRQLRRGGIFARMNDMLRRIVRNA